jgi:hypothetical protein
MYRPKMRVPWTYIIDYREVWPDFGPFVEEIRKAPPTLLHLAQADLPMQNSFGAAIPTEEDFAWIDPPELVAQKLLWNQQYVEALHSAGVRHVVPYICNQTLAGNPDERTGIWKFYDEWDKYEQFGEVSRPEVDPINWMARERDGRLHFNYETRHAAFTPYNQFRYAPCANNPHYHAFEQTMVRLIAKSGYDGIFVDNCILNCYCEHCQGLFREWMTLRYTADELKETFGWSSPGEIEMGHRGGRVDWVKYDPLFPVFLAETETPESLVRWLGTADMGEADVAVAGNGWLWGRTAAYRHWVESRLSPAEREERWGVRDLELWGIRDERDRVLWADTKRFWADSITNNLRQIRAWGVEVRGDSFLVLPNWGSMERLDANEFREEIGHDFARWAPASDCQMWEADGDPGRVAPGLYIDNSLVYKYAFANDATSGGLIYIQKDEPTLSLAVAEAVAGGSSVYIEAGTTLPEVRARYNDLFARVDWFEGYTSSARVALVYSFENLHMENAEHVQQVYRFARYLNDQQVPWDVIREDDLTDMERLSGYSVLIIPALEFVSDETRDTLLAVADTGTVMVLTGQPAAYDMKGCAREGSLMAELVQRVSSGGLGALMSQGDRLVWRASIESLIPSGMTRETMLDIARSDMSHLAFSGERFDMMAAVDSAAGVERFLDGGLLADLVPNWGDLQVADPYRAAGLRVYPWHRQKGDSGDIVAHLLNYNIPLNAAKGERVVEPITDLTLSLALPDGWDVTGAQWLIPGNEPTDISCVVKNGFARIRPTEIPVHALVRIGLGRE